MFTAIYNEIILINLNKKYKRKYCIEYVLILILQLKNNVNNWKTLQKLNIYDCNTTYHYKTIYNQFLRWCSKNILLNTFNKIKSNEKDNQEPDKIIDAVLCYNKYGIENKVVNPEYHKKNATKLSCMINMNGFILSILPFKCKNKKIILNGKKRIIKTSEHDSQTIQSTIDNIDPNINLNFKILLADGGYKSDNVYNYKNNEIRVITPDRKNQVNNLNTLADKEKLKERSNIERVFGRIKLNTERIMLRKDKSLKSFMNWIYIACIEHNLNCK
jgi:hypothetical protein